MDQKNILEICVDSVESAVTAARGGADRVELCSDLLEGGITPSAGLIAAVRARVQIGVFVMIRPRGGDFVYSPSELEVMAADIAEAKRLGVDGVVLGVLTADASVDVERTRHLVELAAPLGVTFHRAIDVTQDMSAASEAVIRTGAHRILTSGGKSTAMRGAAQIAEMVRIANGRIAIMAGSGVRASNAAELGGITRAREFHASLRRKIAGPVGYRNPDVRLGADDEADCTRYGLVEADVRCLRRALDTR
jgi:copper homeostasis protein